MWSLLVVLAFAVFGAANDHVVFDALCGVPSAVAYNLWAWDSAELFPISGEAASTARGVSWVVNVLAFLSVFMS